MAYGENQDHFKVFKHFVVEEMLSGHKPPDPHFGMEFPKRRQVGVLEKDRCLL